MDIHQALEHHQAGRLAEAVDLYQQILQKDPDNTDALHLLGNIACQMGDAALAVNLIGRAHELLPTNLAYLNSLGMALRMQGQYEASIARYTQAMGLAPESASVHFGMANTYLAMGQVGKAEQGFREALALKPDFFEACYNLANLQKSRGEHAAAVDSYQRAIALQPDFADAHHNLGSTYQAMGEFELALASYRQAMAGQLPETHNNMGNIYRAQGRLQQAADAYEAAIRLQSGFMPAYLGLARLLIENGQPADAIEWLNQAAGLAPDDAEIAFNRGIARAQLQQFDQAVSDFERAVQQQPDYVDALYNLGIVLGRLERFADAETYYRKVISLDPSHSGAQINLAAIVADAGCSAEAKALRDAAYTRQNIFEKRAPEARRTVLILFDAGRGNLNLTHLINEQTNNLIDWMIEYADDAQLENLPAYDLVFNAMGDPDITGDVSKPLRDFLATNRKPVLNPPDRVAQTARHRLPALLTGIEGVRIPWVQRLSAPSDWPEPEPGDWPLLVRPVDTHGGVGLERLESESALAAYRERQTGAVYLSPFVDYRSSDGLFRKYRMIFVDREPYPYHLAISDNWLVHYYRTDMMSAPGKQAEELAYLENPRAVLGEKGYRAIEQIGRRLDVDYGGVDFALMPGGDILVFEANTTMLVHPEAVEGPLAHKNLYVKRIFDAFETLLERTLIR